MFELLFAAALIDQGECVVTHEGEAVDVVQELFYDDAHHQLYGTVENLKGDFLIITIPRTDRVTCGDTEWRVRWGK